MACNDGAGVMSSGWFGRKSEQTPTPVPGGCWLPREFESAGFSSLVTRISIALPYLQSASFKIYIGRGYFTITLTAQSGRKQLIQRQCLHTTDEDPSPPAPSPTTGSLPILSCKLSHIFPNNILPLPPQPRLPRPSSEDFKTSLHI